MTTLKTNTPQDLKEAIMDARRQLKAEQSTLEEVYRLQHNLARKQHAYDMLKKYDKYAGYKEEKQHAAFIARHEAEVDKLDEKATAYYDMGPRTVDLLAVTFGQMIDDLFRFKGMTDDNALPDANAITEGLAEFRQTPQGDTYPLSSAIDRAVDKITTVVFLLYIL